MPESPTKILDPLSPSQIGLELAKRFRAASRNSRAWGSWRPGSGGCKALRGWPSVVVTRTTWTASSASGQIADRGVLAHDDAHGESGRLKNR